MLRRMSLTGDAMARHLRCSNWLSYCGPFVIAMTIGGLLAGLFIALASGLVSNTARGCKFSVLSDFSGFGRLLCRCVRLTWILCISCSVQYSH